ncbi:helix-turn-helix domain-containing protein [Cyclobacterium xiamenense]|jgi:AraC-like DNA-binding protein|uniref:helix-turn-helix domain-containing protein n=1 Tax=Cyclobacterium xiamenense TaxID=1297121 RepID=UPI001F50639C|nr:helix-turn-helix transcriptional regulator [Cyclobacterium xiamenense]
MAVEEVLREMGLAFEKVELGLVRFSDPPDSWQTETFERRLDALGFAVAKSRETIWVETCKVTLIQLLEEGADGPDGTISQILADKTGISYSRLSQLFSSLQGVTIEQYFIELKIEKAKEYLSYASHNISETAWKLGYSSMQHFSAQFKKHTGMTPSQFRKLSQKPRKFLDQVGDR